MALNGVEEAGGLRIVCVPSSIPRPTYTRPPPPTNTPTTNTPQTALQEILRPPFPRFSSPVLSLRSFPLISTMREDSDADKYIRLMASETEGLRRLSIARGGGVLTGERADPAFRFPGPGSQGTMINEIAWKKKTGKEKDSFDTIEELSKGNMERNKLIRPAHPHPPTPTPAPNWTKDRAQITAG
ncbi:hypothetical protein PILCRDRAFT_9522 [Piloderma croceum F 1598]|uniref:Uncharacterized protein n=1 Tax=Piloderma croceum (strain F 1598) TaxID=765440 RepID=A0A0C3FLE8_PILCF|nr:hypothetical protein PILCRDRAFT_9522 [Piloderma croceum F 1598]